MRLHDLLLDKAALTPEASAVRDGSGRWTYAQLADAASRAAQRIAAAGVGPGDRVMVQASARRSVVALLYACSMAGAVFVPLSRGTKRFHVSSIVEDAEPAMIVTDAPELVPYLVNSVSLDDLVNGAGSNLPRPALEPANPDGLALLLYTSGTTSSRPKAIASRHRQVLFATDAIAQCLRYQPDDVVLCRLPLSFDYGLYQALLCAYAGAELVLCGAESDARLVTLARECGATVLPAVPSLAQMLLGLLRRDDAPISLRLITNTGEVLPAAVVAALRERIPSATIQLMFGLTECKRVTIMEPDGDRRRPGSVGRPLPGTSVTIIDESGDPVGVGEVGEIVVQGDHVMAGYWRAPELSARIFGVDPATSRPLLRTGDYGWLDADGYLYFTGRRDQLFKRRGMRMSTIEIEAAARDVPGVIDAVVVPPSHDRDAVIVAVTQLTSKQVLQALRERLNPEKVPTVCRIVTDIPRLPNGKIDRVAVSVALEGES